MPNYATFQSVNKSIPSFNSAGTSGTSLTTNAAVLAAYPSARVTEAERLSYDASGKLSSNRLGNMIIGTYMFTNEVIGDRIFIGRKPYGSIVKRIRTMNSLPLIPDPANAGNYITSPSSGFTAPTAGAVNIGVFNSNSKFAGGHTLTNAAGAISEATMFQHFGLVPQVDKGLNYGVQGAEVGSLYTQEDIYLYVQTAVTGSPFCLFSVYIELENILT